MISLPLKFDEVESVEEFVNMVKRLDYDVDVKIGRCVFDAKSLMSVLMIAGNPDAVVEAHTNDIEAFKKKFKDYLQVRKKSRKRHCVVRCMVAFLMHEKAGEVSCRGDVCMVK